MSFEKPQEIENPTIEEDNAVGLPFNVILFNDDWHSFDEVINQLIKAIHCSFAQARSFAFEVHVKGKSMVFTGDLQQCLKVSSVLEEIALHTQVTS
jgi:ATP-dependent Clp protease adapter protein ClpS